MHGSAWQCVRAVTVPGSASFSRTRGGGVGGFPAFHCFHYLSSSQILVVICGDLWSFAVVCDGLSVIVIPLCLCASASGSARVGSATLPVQWPVFLQVRCRNLT